MQRKRNLIIISMPIIIFCLITLLIPLFTSPNKTGESSAIIKLATTSSFENSGLARYLIHHFEGETDIAVEHLVYGSGQVIELAKKGDVDIIITHAPKLEKKLIANRPKTKHSQFMYNEFIIAGPTTDPAQVQNSETATAALQAIYNKQHFFVSRDDNSGTHLREVKLWQQAGFNPNDFATNWYIKIGRAMGAAIGFAQEKRAYIMSDLATWLNYDKSDEMAVLYKGDDGLRNVYSVSLIDVKASRASVWALRFYRWITGEKAARLIDDFRINNRQVFVSLTKPQLD